MGFFDRFTKSFEDEVAEAIEKVNGMNLGVTGLKASINGKVVTLGGEAPDLQVKTKVMEAFNSLVDTDNTINTIGLPPKPEPAPAPAPEAVPAETAAEERIYEVVSGDTLGAIAQKYYGKAGAYMKIFEANRDILDDPNLIKVGQKLRIPE